MGESLEYLTQVQPIAIHDDATERPLERTCHLAR
jgi:hypothetical protein